MAWTIKQASLKTGIPIDSLRYYDKLGIISPKRHVNGYRYYDEKDMSNLQYITVMKYAKFTLSEIKMMIGLFGNEPSPECTVIARSILASKSNMLRQAVLNYQNIIKLLDQLLPMVESIEAYCDNQSDIDTFVNQIFDDIQQGNFQQTNPTQNKKKK